MILLYAVGQFGWSLASFGVLNLLAYFYMPIEGGEGQNLFPSFVFPGSVLFGLTVIGLIGFSGRLFDAVTDPMIAHWSDRTKSRLGKRRIFLLCAALPFAFFSAAVFFPLFPGQTAGNAVWLGISVTLFYLCMTLYVVPYNALIAELGRTAAERLHIATALSVTWALGFALGSQVYLLQDILEKTMDPLAAFQRCMILFAGLSAIAMLVPALFLDEHRYTARTAVQESGGYDEPKPEPEWTGNSIQSFSLVWQRPAFRWFAFAYFLYWLSLTFIEMGVAYYVTSLMGRDKAFASTFFIVVFGLSFLFYFPVNRAAGYWGKRRVVLGGFSFFGAAFVLTALLQPDSRAQVWMIPAIQGCASIALATFGILPNAIVGDLADQHRMELGRSVSGMYFAVQTLVMKAGTSVAMLLFPTFLLYETAGIRGSAVAAAVFCAAGYLAFLRYREIPVQQEKFGKS